MELDNIKHIYFDLDNTLWDFSGNSKRILSGMYKQFNLYEKGIKDFETFHKQYKFRNDNLWNAYRNGDKTREQVRLQRFLFALDDFGIKDFVTATKMAEHYVHHTKMQTDLLPDAIEILNYLHTKYWLHIITNGFDEVQYFKLTNSGIKKYFKTITTAEEAKALKPDIQIFNTAFQKINVKANETIYIGDTPDVDGIGAKNAGMEFILFNPGKKQDVRQDYFQIHSLQELQLYL